MEDAIRKLSGTNDDVRGQQYVATLVHAVATTSDADAWVSQELEVLHCAGIDAQLDERSAVGSCTLVTDPTYEDFEPEELRGVLDDTRVDVLVDGDVPSPEEFDLWRQRYHDEPSGSAIPLYVFVWAVTGQGANPIYAATQRTYGGPPQAIGLFRTFVELLDRLRSEGTVRDLRGALKQ